jgi:ParB family chromosome partitioning protein
VPKSTTPPKLPGRRVARRSSAAIASPFGDLADGALRSVALDAIAPNPHQPRRHFDEAALQGLADSIAERGVLQPPIVRAVGETYELVAGERRWRAARLAGLMEIEVLVRDHDNAASLQDALMENVAREDLSPIEAARAYATIIEDLGITREALGKRLGQSRVSVSNHLRLLDLPDPVLDLIDRGELGFAHGRALLLCDDHATRTALARQAVAAGWSTRQLEAAARSAGAPRARAKAKRKTADRNALAQRASDAASRATGLDLRVRVTDGGSASLVMGDLDTLKGLLVRLGAPADALDEPPAARRDGGSRAR